MMMFQVSFASDGPQFYNLGDNFSPLSYAVLSQVIEERVESVENVKIISVRRGILSRLFFFKRKWRKLEIEASLVELDEVGLQKFKCGMKIIEAFEIIFIDK